MHFDRARKSLGHCLQISYSGIAVAAMLLD
jgi:hypothetical protein